MVEFASVIPNAIIAKPPQTLPFHMGFQRKGSDGRPTHVDLVEVLLHLLKRKTGPCHGGKLKFTSLRYGNSSSVNLVNCKFILSTIVLYICKLVVVVLRYGDPQACRCRAELVVELPAVCILHKNIRVIAISDSSLHYPQIPGLQYGQFFGESKTYSSTVFISP